MGRVAAARRARDPRSLRAAHARRQSPARRGQMDPAHRIGSEESRVRRVALLALVVVACTRPDRALTIVGTSDLHGHVERLPLLGGYLTALRAHRTVLVVDGGDLFQGTIVS